MKGLFLILIITGMLVAGCDSNSGETPDNLTTPDTIITFDDPKLKEAIYAELNISRDQEITLEDLLDLTYLYVSDKGVSKLSGLEYCSNLQNLELDNNSITDISPLASLTKLRYLDLSENSIVDISPLASLTNLWALNLHTNLIEDISPLVANSGLSEDRDFVLLFNNPLSDISLNEYIPQLEERGVVVSLVAY